jgi:hypothetical protein
MRTRAPHGRRQQPVAAVARHMALPALLRRTSLDLPEKDGRRPHGHPPPCPTPGRDRPSAALRLPIAFAAKGLGSDL